MSSEMRILQGWLRELEAEVGGSVLQEPGMEFGAQHAWWGERKPRPRPHEGVDVATFRTSLSELRRLDDTPIRALEDCTAVACFPDIIGRTVVLQCSADRRRCWLLGHLRATDVHPGQRFARGEAIGQAAVSENRCPSHLHLSLLRLVAEEGSWESIDWDTIHSCRWLAFSPIALPVLDGVEFSIADHRASSSVQLRTDGRLTEHLATLYGEVFGNDVDIEAWIQRMLPGRSWSLTTRHGFMVAHIRGEAIVNIWLAGVASKERGGGHFHALVRRLLAEVGLARQWTMTTRPEKFGKMYSILSSLRCVHRCDEASDIAAGKARFSVPAWVVAVRLHWRAAAGAAVLAGLAACGLGAAVAVRLAGRKAQA